MARTTTPRVHHHTQAKHVRAAGFDPTLGYCGPTALARALQPAGMADDPDTLPGKIRHVHENLTEAGFQRGGGMYGKIHRAAIALALPGKQVDVAPDESRGGWSTRSTWYDDVEVFNHRVQYPTVVAWLRDHCPGNVTRAVVRCTGHLGYVERVDGTWHLYDLRPRARVDHAFILPPHPGRGWWATLNGATFTRGPLQPSER